MPETKQDIYNDLCKLLTDYEHLEDVEDYYTYYVLILEIPEDIFWFADYSFLRGVVENKTAYDGWLNYAIEKERDRK